MTAQTPTLSEISAGHLFSGLKSIINHMYDGCMDRDLMITNVVQDPS